MMKTIKKAMTQRKVRTLSCNFDPFLPIFLDKTEPLVSVGSVLTKDTSMDGERMTVSDEESIVGTDSRIATTGAAELKVIIFTEEIA